MYQRPSFYFPPLSDTPAVMGLLIGCAIFFLLGFIGTLLNVNVSLAEMYAWQISAQWPASLHFWQPLTYPFVHGTSQFLQLLFDGLGLYFFGGSLERAWGSARFLIYFFASAILQGALLMIFWTRAGFSGELAGLGPGIWLTIIVGFATLNPYATIYLMMMIPLQARWIAWGSIAVEIFAYFGFYGGVIQAIVSVGLLAFFAYAFTSRDFRANFTRRGPKGPSLKERFDRWQQRKRMRQWQRRVSKIDRPEDLFKDK